MAVSVSRVSRKILINKKRNKTRKIIGIQLILKYIWNCVHTIGYWKLYEFLYSQKAYVECCKKLFFYKVDGGQQIFFSFSFFFLLVVDAEHFYILCVRENRSATQKNNRIGLFKILVSSLRDSLFSTKLFEWVYIKCLNDFLWFFSHHFQSVVMVWFSSFFFLCVLIIRHLN